MSSNVLVKDWIDQYAPQQHAVFRSDGLNSQRAKPQSSHQHMAGDLTNDFCNIIQQYENSLPPQALYARIDVRGAHSWEDVIRAAKDAEAAYLAEAKRGARGAIRGYLRRFGDYSGVATPWVGLLPNDKYFSVLCGGLKIVLGMAAKRSERRTEIFQAFELLPAVIEKTQRCHEIFPQSLELRDRALRVYLDILTVIEAMVACLVEKRILARIKDGLKGPLADQDLDEKKRRFRMSMESLQEQVDYLHISSSARANGTVAVMLPSIQHTEQAVTSIETNTRALSNSAVQISTGIDGLRSDVGSHEKATQLLKREIEAQRKANEEQSRAIRHLSSVLEDVLKNAEWNRAQMMRSYDAIERSVELKAFQNQLQCHLGHTPAAADQELDVVRRKAQSCDARSQGAMYWVLQSPRFKRWAQNSDSDVLVVNGNAEDGMARYSSTSLLCAMLVRSLGGQQATHVLHFFCGSHNSKFDLSAGPIGLIRSLTAQLLSIHQFDIGFLRFGQWEDGLRANDVKTYCRMFCRLVEQLPTSIIFCVIDSISVFEVEKWVDDLQTVLASLLEVVADEQMSARLKLLITSASRSRCLNSLLSEDAKLNVPTDTGSQRLLTSRSTYSELEDSRRSPLHGTDTYSSSSYENMYDAGFE